jgi:hypothetical protein
LPAPIIKPLLQLGKLPSKGNQTMLYKLNRQGQPTQYVIMPDGGPMINLGDRDKAESIASELLSAILYPNSFKLPELPELPASEAAAVIAQEGNTRMNDEQLREWEQITAAATAGPWRVDDGKVEIHGSIFVNPGVWGGSDSVTAICDCGTGQGAADDAAFIVAAREAMPLLSAEVRQLRQDLATARMYSTLPPEFGSEGYADWAAAREDREWQEQKRSEVPDIDA